MKKIILFLAVAALLAGCGGRARKMTVTIETQPLSPDKAAIIIYHQSGYKQGFLNEFPIRVNTIEQGVVIAEKPLRIEVGEGNHTLSSHKKGLLSKPFAGYFSAGKTYYFQVKRQYHTFADTLVILPSDPLHSYEIISHRPETP